MQRLLFLFTLLVCPALSTNAQDAALAGSWSGRWTDSRPAYNGSGGDFSCQAVEKAANVWTCTFKLGEGQKWVVDLKGKPDGKELRFTGAYKLDETHGVYFLKASLNEKGEFSGEYSGPDEEGTFRMEKKGN